MLLAQPGSGVEFSLGPLHVKMSALMVVEGLME